MAHRSVLAIGRIGAAIGISLGAVAALAAEASAATDGSPAISGIIIQSAGSSASSVGLLTITAQATSNITNLTAHLLSGPDDVLDVSDFTLSSGIPSDGTWTLQTPITQGQLPLGDYSITVDATDSGGDSVTGVTAGTLYFLIQPGYTLKASPADARYGEQVTFSGTETGTWPDGSTAPLPDAAITLADVYGNPVATTQTSASGQFTLNVIAGHSLDLPNTDYFVNSAVNATTAAGESSGVYIQATYDPLKLTAKLSAPDVKYGKTEVVSGTVTYDNGSKWGPLAGATVYVTAYPGAPAAAAPMTNSQGKYSAKLPSVMTQQWNLETPGVSGGEWFQVASLARQETVQLPLAFTKFKVSLSPQENLSVLGCMSATGAGIEAFPGQVTIQYSASAHGPWKRLKVVSASPGGAAGCDGETNAVVDVSLPVRLAAAYYRADYFGTASYQPAVSAAAYASRYLSKITSFSATPSHLTSGAKITVSGRLWQDVHGWHPYSGQKIEVLYQVPGASNWVTAATVHASASGRFKVRVRVGYTARYLAEFPGDKSHLWYRTRAVKITVS